MVVSFMQFPSRWVLSSFDSTGPRRRSHRSQQSPSGRFKPLRQIIESIFDTLKGQLDLERHAGRTLAGVSARISQRLLALTTVIWQNDRIGAPVLRSLTAYDH